MHNGCGHWPPLRLPRLLLLDLSHNGLPSPGARHPGHCQREALRLAAQLRTWTRASAALRNLHDLDARCPVLER